jgi:HEAT repeat protein
MARNPQAPLTMTKQYTHEEIFRDIKSRDYENVKFPATEFLRTLDDEQFLARLFDYLDNPAKEIQDAARHSLYLVANPVLAQTFMTALASDNWKWRATAAIYFYHTKNPVAMKLLIDYLKDEYSAVRYNSVVALGAIGDHRATLPVLAVLNNLAETEKIRRWAANSLLNLDYKSYFADYLTIINSTEEPKAVRAALIYICQKARNKIALPTLLQVGNSRNDPIRKDALLALSQFNSKDAYNTLLEALTDADDIIRHHALKGLGKLGFPTANRFIIGFLGDENVQTRYYAVKALGRLRAAEALPQLEWMMENDNGTLEVEGEAEVIKRAAKSAIWRIQESNMQIDFFYFADCPSHERALEILREVMDEQHITETVRIIEVTTDEDARKWDFYGSPTIRVNGQDIAPLPTDIAEPGLACRAYRRPDGKISPLPPREYIAAALEQARQ